MGTLEGGSSSPSQPPSLLLRAYAVARQDG